MAKYVPDIKTQRWVIITPTRATRPNDEQPAVKTSVVCPFCEGQEHLTPPEVSRIGGGEKDKPGWQVRVVPNKYPITDIHEVIIHSPSDTDDIERLPDEQVTRIMTSYRDRYRTHQENGQVMIFCNHGPGAGASLKHPHSQLVVVPKQINLDAVSLEPVTNIIEETATFIAFCPDFSQWPYEVWLAPKNHKGKRFGDTPDKELSELGSLLKRTLVKIEKQIVAPSCQTKDACGSSFVYNYYIYHGADWFIRIIPRAIHRAGFELGTGLSVNVVDPTEAARQLKELKIED